MQWDPRIVAVWSVTSKLYFMYNNTLISVFIRRVSRCGIRVCPCQSNEMRSLLRFSWILARQRRRSEKTVNKFATWRCQSSGRDRARACTCLEHSVEKNEKKKKDKERTNSDCRWHFVLYVRMYRVTTRFTMGPFTKLNSYASVERALA